MAKKNRVLRCRRCGNVVQTNDQRSVDTLTDIFEDRCPDRNAPGGYWYCSYQELVPINRVKFAVKNERKRILDLMSGNTKGAVALYIRTKMEQDAKS